MSWLLEVGMGLLLAIMARSGDRDGKGSPAVPEIDQ
jgi:hypothetical protein